MSSEILLIDDDKVPMKYYLMALKKAGFSVKQCRETDEALNYATMRKKNISLIILDIIMSPGEKYNNCDTKDGTLTGIFLMDDLENIPLRVPYIILTNNPNPFITQYINSKKGHEIKYFQKKDLPPFELVEIVKTMIAGNY